MTFVYILYAIALQVIFKIKNLFYKNDGVLKIKVFTVSETHWFLASMWLYLYYKPLINGLYFLHKIKNLRSREIKYYRIFRIDLLIAYSIYFLIINITGLNSTVWYYIVIWTNILDSSQNSRKNWKSIDLYSNLNKFLIFEVTNIATKEKELNVTI